MSEATFKTKVIKYLKTRFPNAFIWKVSDQWYAGIPDIYMLNEGISYFIELKIKGNKASKIQLHTIEKLISAGANAGVAYSIEDVSKILNLK